MSALSLVSTSDGQQLAYRLEGETDRPVLVLSNSIATTLHMWDGIIPALRRHFRVLRYDARGHGESTAPRGPYSIARLGQDVLDLLDTLQIDRAHFLGLSLGGFVGQWLGANAPQRLRRLVLSNTSPYLGPPQQWDRLIESVLRAPHMAEAADRFLGNWFPPSMRRGGAGVAAQFHAMVMRTPAAGLAGNYAAVRDADLRPLLPRIAVPTLVIAGHAALAWRTDRRGGPGCQAGHARYRAPAQCRGPGRLSRGRAGFPGKCGIGKRARRGWA